MDRARAIESRSLFSAQISKEDGRDDHPFSCLSRFRCIPETAGVGSAAGGRPLLCNAFEEAFTLLEVMIAVAFLGIAMLALLSLHHSDMQSVVRARELTQAAMLAQALMTNAEMARFPDVGRTSGDAQKIYSGQYPDLRWQRVVEQSKEFSDIRRVRITVFYGPRYRRRFVLSEFIHNPLPQQTLEPTMQNGVTGQQPGARPLAGSRQ